MINIHTVKLELESSGWTLLSSDYQNLTTPLSMKCPVGHPQTKNFGDWRKRPICEVCLAGDKYQIKRKNIPPKPDGARRILAIDGATVSTGYALYDDNKLITYGVHHSDESMSLTARINDVKHWMLSVIEEWKPDLIGIEHIQLQSYGAVSDFSPQVETYRKLANLQGVLLDAAFENKISCELVRPTEWRKQCGISVGDSHRENKKKQAQEKVAEWYGLHCTQDEADAICIGKYFTSKTVFAQQKPKIAWGV